MRIFGGDRIKKMMQTLRVPENEPIENRLVSKALEGAQERVEGYYFDLRKQVLSYDDVLNKQRNAIYTLRRNALMYGQWKEANTPAEALHEHIKSLLAQQSAQVVALHTSEGSPEDWNIEELAEIIHSLINTPVATIRDRLSQAIGRASSEGPTQARQELTNAITASLAERLEARVQELGADTMHNLEKAATVRAIDTLWMDHLDTMDYLRTGIGLRGYGQRDPLVEYQKEGYELFQKLIAAIKSSIIDVVFRAQAVREERLQGHAQHESVTAPHRIGQPTAGAQPNPESVLTHNPHKNVGRNDPCPCGSGKKFKKCHGKEA